MSKRPTIRTPENWPSPPENDPIGPVRKGHEQQIALSRQHHRGSNTPSGMQDTPPGGNTPYLRPPQRFYPTDIGDVWREDSDDEYYTPSKCKQCKSWQLRLQELEEDLRATRKERERLELQTEKLRKDLQSSENSIAMLTKEKEKLRVDIKRLKEKQQANELEPQPEYYSVTGDNRRVKDLEDEIYTLKNQKHSLKAKCEELQKMYWLLKDENQKLKVRLLDEGEKTRKPGDGGSEAASARSSFASESAFHRGVPGRHSANRLSGRDSSHGFTKDAAIRCVQSDNQAQGSDEPVREQDYPSASKSHRSAPSEGSDYFPVPPLLNLQSSVPDEQTDVFIVLGDTVSRSVLPEGQSNEQQIALMYTLQNCHSVQELIHCLLTNQGSQIDDQYISYKVENEHLRKKVEHYAAKNDTLSSSFESSKQMATQMYHHSNKVEANNTRLRHTLYLCQQVFEVTDLISEMRDVRVHDQRNPAHAGSGFSMNEYASLDSTTLRSPDNQKQSLASRTRGMLQALESMSEIQGHMPTSFGGHTWVGNTLSQTTGTSGLSSISGSVEMDIDMERLRVYAQALRSHIHHLVNTMTPIDGLKGLELVKIPDKVKDCEQSDGSTHILDLEEAANAEELCKAREERAEMKSHLYMMEHEKRRMELDVCHSSLMVKQYERVIEELKVQLSEEKGKRRREREKGRNRKDVPLYPGESDMAIDLQDSVEREKRLGKRYSDLYMFMLSHIRVSHENVEQLMAFVKELRRANSALVEAFEKCKKHHEAEKKRMKQECLQYVNRQSSSALQPISSS